MSAGGVLSTVVLPSMPMASKWLLAPEAGLGLAACLALLFDAYVGSGKRAWTATFSMVLLVGVALLVMTLGFSPQRVVLMSGSYVSDPLASFLKLVAVLVMGTAVFYSQEYLDHKGLRGGEYQVLCLTALLGVFVLISAGSLLTVYLGIELLSLSLYAMVAFDRDSGTATEAAIKYFVLGAIGSGMLLYGMSMIYGMTGTLQLDQLAMVVQKGNEAGLLIGLTFIVVAVAFKFGAVPFHMWVPDVYQGAPTSVTMYIATVSTLGSFALMARLVAYGFAGLPAMWTQMLIGVAVLSLLIGNLAAIAQTNLKRMLAYSAIANAGLVLLAFATAEEAGYRAALNFTVAYVLTTLAAFGVVLTMAGQDAEHDELADYKGLAQRDPLLASLMLIIMFSTAGIPPFVGFWAKLWIIQALIHQHLWLAIFAVVMSVVGAFYYLRVVWFMYFEPSATKVPHPAPGIGWRNRMRLVLLLNTLLVLLLGLLPNWLMSFCQQLYP